MGCVGSDESNSLFSGGFWGPVYCRGCKTPWGETKQATVNQELEQNGN